MITILKDWIIPLGSVLLSVWFAASAKKDAEKADHLLVQVTEAIQGWQSKIMNSATNILDSLPQVVEGKNNAVRMKAIESLIEIMQRNISNPDGRSAFEHEQNLKALTIQISALVNSTNNRGSKS